MNKSAAKFTQPASEWLTPVHGVLQRKCACGNHMAAGGECEGCAKKRGEMQRKSRAGAGVTAVPPIVHEVLNSPGQPLDVATREFMEPRFGHNFSQVRVHTDEKAVASARSVNALAYTVGRDIVFGSHHAASGSRQGRGLIAHELAHVVQQRHDSAPHTPLSYADSEHGPAELEADRAADRIMKGESGAMVSAQPGRALHRKVNVDNPKDLIANPTGKGLVQTNAQTVEGYLQTLCSGGSVAVDGSTGDVKMDASFCTQPGFQIGHEVLPAGPVPASVSKEPTGCGCICDMVGSANDYTIVVDDKDWPHTSGRVVTTPSPNSSKLWGAASVSGKAMTIDPWLVLGHEFCGHAWLAEQGLPDNNATRGKGGHQETVGRENELRKEHGIEARGSFKDPFCGESFWQDKAGPGPVQWSSYMKTCEAWRMKTYGKKYKISDKIP